MRQALRWMAAMAVALALTGCDRRPGAPDGNAGQEGAANETLAPSGDARGSAADNAAAPAEAREPPRSILRPDVVPPLPVLEIEALHAVIPFGASGLVLDETGRAAVDGALDMPVMRMGGPIVLRGHTDSRGTDGDNLVASRIRAESVRDYLIEKGVAADRIRVIALGEMRPIAPNAHADGTDDPDGRAKNRRVEIDVEPPATPAQETAEQP